MWPGQGQPRVVLPGAGGQVAFPSPGCPELPVAPDIEATKQRGAEMRDGVEVEERGRD